MRLLSWNVNGARAIYKKGFMDWLLKEKPDILCLQETKAWEDQIPLDMRWCEGYNVYYSRPERRGYSGVALYSREKPESIKQGFDARFDSEGRVIEAKYPGFTLLNVYFPNGGASDERLNYKLEFYSAFLEHIDSLKDEGEKIIFCGDVNTAHREIDLARPRQNMNNSGFKPEEREWLDRFIEHGYLDSFRLIHPEKVQYTWWDQKTRSRERDVGWRIDYFFADEALKDKIKGAYILPEVMGSDHCPVGLELKQ